MEKFYQYIEDVRTGKIPTGRYTKLAVRRHLNDLKRKDIYFDEDEAQFVIDFFMLLNLNTDPLNFRPFELSPFQCFIAGCLFGWKHKGTNKRKYDIAYIEVARKNGKTFFSAGLALYLMFADGEDSPEIYTGANSKSQAFICFKDAVRMAKASPALRDEIKVRHFDAKSRSSVINAELKYLSADADKHDGLRPHGVILDEIHEYKTNKLYGIFTSAMVNRTQPLLVMITTAGFNKVYWCYREQRKHVIDILENNVEADNVFGIIYHLDKKDDWKDPNNWIKANPNMGVSLLQSKIAQAVRTAQIKPDERVNVLTKNLNMWEDTLDTFIERDKWQSAVYEPTEDELKRAKRVHIGGDLSYTTDITAYTVGFEFDDGRRYFKQRFFVPIESAEKRQEATGIPYMTWIEQGHLIPCDGETVDYELVKEYVLADIKEYRVLTGGFDYFNSNQLLDSINKEIGKIYVRLAADQKYEVIKPFYTIDPSFRTMSQPTSLMVHGLYTKPQNILHDGNPVMEWMIMNVVLAYKDDHRKPVKGKSKEKIDGVISTLLALEQLEYWSDKEIRKTSVYDERDIRILA
jgi:phage terminase large subunit-like protein